MVFCLCFVHCGMVVERPMMLGVTSFSRLDLFGDKMPLT